MCAAVDNCTLALACSDLRKVPVVATISFALQTFTVALPFVAADAFLVLQPRVVMKLPLLFLPIPLRWNDLD